jgi:WW domain-containing oxidoreductase
MARKTAEQVTDGVDLTGKTALITGVNSGIGEETMRVLALRGARVFGTARSEAKASNACAAVQGEVIPLACELTDPDSISVCVAAIGDTPLDIVVANAGIMALPSLELCRGVEMQFATNHLGHFELLTSLMPNMSAAPDSRVAMVSSAAHRQAPGAGIDFDNLDGSRGYSGFRAYGQSKLANVLFANELNRRTPEHVKVNSLHPGVIQTNLGRHMQGPFALMLGLIMFPFMSTVPQGAATSCYVVASPGAAEVSGQYFADCRPAKVNPLADDAALARRLWETSESLIRRSP